VNLYRTCAACLPLRGGLDFAWFVSPALLIAFPLFGALLLLFFGKRIGRAAGVIASGLLTMSFVLGVVLFSIQLGTAGDHRDAYVHLFDWIKVGTFQVGADLTLDQLSMVMVLVITGVGTLIHIYSIGYMAGDPRYPRFFCYLNLFAAFMLTLVLAGNLLLLYVGWEGVGLCSFLLIGFWFDRAKASNAAKKAFLVNRVGDFAFLIGIFVLAKTVTTLSIPVINAAASGPNTLGAAVVPSLSTGVATVAALLLFVGATGKSAQIPLYVWLPDAMEGPTPVSALIHAATMVTAGVYMVARLSPLFQVTSALTVVAWVGALTALWAALMASFEFDIKRVLAYSTISQLGYMFLANGVQGYSAAMFHLVTHAFFKALMFLGAGAVMHSLGGETDMRKMGGLRKAMPITGFTFLVGWLAVSGIFPLAGFWSKDAILASAWHQGEYALWAIGVGTALLTAFYMSRLYFRVFEGPLKVPEGVEVHHGGRVHDAPVTMAVALVPLALLSIVGGALNLPGSLALEHFLEPVVGASQVPGGLTPWVLASLALVAGLIGIALAYMLYVSSDGRSRRAALYPRLRAPIIAAANKFYVDELYGRAIVLPGKALANLSAYTLDARGIDGVVNGTGNLIAGLSDRVRRVQSGYVRNYAATFLLGVVVLFSIVAVRLAAG
jgi:NADH-quinone oxidoreductase subunit L